MPAGASSRLRSMRDRWRTLPMTMKDIVLAAVVTAFAFVPTLSHIGPEIGDLPSEHAGVVGFLADVGLTLAMCLPLVVRSRRPASCLAIAGTAFAIGQMLGYPDTFGKVAPLLALYAAGAYLDRLRQVTAAALTAGYVVLAVALHGLGSPQKFQDYLAFYLAMVVIWLAGAGMRRWRAEESERRRLAAQLATSAERARISRELHDVVTHHVTAMVVQADAAQFLVDSAPTQAGDGLNAISDTGRRALTELRTLLGVLEATGESGDETTSADRTPTMGEVSDLVARARLAGQPVELAEHGEERPRSVDVDLAAYRVVQEALTNALKYAAGAATTVLVRHEDDRVEIEVTNAGSTVATSGSPRVSASSGRGLTGLRERVRMLDGELIADSLDDGGFRVHAVLPAGSTP